MSRIHLAVDIGAESGRVMAGDGQTEPIEVHRFANTPRQADGHLRWDSAGLVNEILTGLTKAAARWPEAASIGVDTWGVDYALIDEHGDLVEEPIVYRDRRIDSGMAHVHARVPAEDLFARTGVGPLPYNTVYQLAVHHRDRPDSLRRAKHLLFMPDWLHFQFSGVAANEHTIAGTSGLLDRCTRAWRWDLIDALGLPRHLFGRVVAAGTVLGPMRPELVKRCGFSKAPQIIAPPGHDTAAAAACVRDGAYLSSGTWSLIGLPVAQPIQGEAVRAAGWSNEVCADGRPRFNRNIIGLWIVQNCRRAFAAAGRDHDYAALTVLAQAAPAPAKPLDVDDPRFFPLDGDPMPARVQAWYRERNLPAPDSDGAIVRAALEGLAAAYAKAVEELGRFTGKPVERLTVIGGGVKNRFLFDLLSTACRCPVIAGPVEATAQGNLRVQSAAF